MRLLFSILSVVSFWILVAGEGGGALARLHKLRDRRSEQLRKHAERNTVQSTPKPSLEKRASPFLNSRSEKFAVNGSALPDVDWDVGESYAGLLPISDHPDESRQLYFWYFPSENEAATDEITIWLQGGPGAASTAGLLLENGPLIWQPGTFKPARNTFSWTNLTNVVWIDQPVGTGFSVGTPNITNEFELTEQFMGFFKNFVDTFNMHGFKVYLTGESYSGYYIPYIANGFMDAKDTEYFNFKGAAINDPIIGNEIIQFEGVAMQYVNTWAPAFGFDSVTMANFTALNSKCGYDKYLEKYFTFPPPSGHFPGVFGDGNYSTYMPPNCEIQGQILDVVEALNPCFNYDHIFDTCPFPYNSLGAGFFNADFNPPGPKVWYRREDVKEAIHAPKDVEWAISSDIDVFVGKKLPWEVHYHDVSLPPTDNDIVTKMIEATNNIIVGAGGLDFQLPANGTLFVFQNMTWHGAQGFSKYPDKTLYVPEPPIGLNPNSLSGHGNMGAWTCERGLTFYVSYFAGHEGPWYTPGVAYRIIQTMLGRIPDLSYKGNF